MQSQLEKELKTVERELEQMKDAQDIETLRTHWQYFLFRIERIWDIVEREYSDPRYQRFLKPYRKLRKNDELLQYIRHARHTETHGISVSVDKNLAISIREEFGRPFSVQRLSHEFKDGTLTINFDTVDCLYRYRVKPVPTSPELQRITNRGTSYAPPKKHLRNYIADLRPVAIASLGLEFYRTLVHEAGAIDRCDPQ